MQIRQLINGQLVAGAGNPIPVMNPSTGGELIAIGTVEHGELKPLRLILLN